MLYLQSKLNWGIQIKFSLRHSLICASCGYNWFLKEDYMWMQINGSCFLYYISKSDLKKKNKNNLRGK